MDIGACEAFFRRLACDPEGREYRYVASISPEGTAALLGREEAEGYAVVASADVDHPAGAARAYLLARPRAAATAPCAGG